MVDINNPSGSDPYAKWKWAVQHGEYDGTYEQYLRDEWERPQERDRRAQSVIPKRMPELGDKIDITLKQAIGLPTPVRPPGYNDALQRKILSGKEAGMSKQEIYERLHPESIEPKFGLPTPVRREPKPRPRPRQPIPRITQDMPDFMRERKESIPRTPAKPSKAQPATKKTPPKTPPRR